MKQIRPYRTLVGAARALDNGGRFYNVFTAAGDEMISRAELKKAAGLAASWPQAILFFEMSLGELDDRERREVAGMLSPDLAALREKHLPRIVTPDQFALIGPELKGRTAIVEGRARWVQDVSRFGGMIIIPIIVGKVPSFMTVPITQQFDVYALLDERESPAPGGALVATPKRKQPQFDDARVRFGGVVKQFEPDKSASGPGRHYIEAAHYTEAEDLV